MSTRCRRKSPATPATSGHRKTGVVAGCKCAYCECMRARDRARRPPLIRGPKIKSPDTNGHRKRLVKGCGCAYCEWTRARGLRRTLARLEMPGVRKKVREREQARREQRKKPRVYVSPPASGHTRSGSKRGCYCAYCKWERNRIKEDATARRRRAGVALAKATTPPTSGHAKHASMAGCYCAYCEWRREYARRTYRKRNPLETERAKLRAASPPTSGHPKNCGAVRHCKCAWCEWKRGISRSRGELKDSLPGSPATSHPKYGQLMGCYCAYCEWCRDRARARKNAQKKREGRTPVRPQSPPTSGHTKKGGQLRGCYCDYCEWNRERRVSPKPQRAGLKRSRYPRRKSISPSTSGHPKGRGPLGGCHCDYCEWKRERRRPSDRMSARLRNRKKREAVKAAADQVLKDNPHLKILMEAS